MKRSSSWAEPTPPSVPESSGISLCLSLGLPLGIVLLAGCMFVPETSDPDSAPEGSVTDLTIPPPPPVLEAPEIILNAKWTFGASAKLKWSSVEGATRYQVQASRSPNFEPGSGVDFEVPDSAKSGSRLEAELTADVALGETLYFRVRALAEPNVKSRWTPGARRVELARPDVVTPASGAHVQDARPRFAWASIPGASSYELIVAPHGLEAKPITAHIPVDASKDPSFQPPGPLPAPGIYKVKIRSMTETLQSDWSTENTFSFDPPRPRILEPRSGEELAYSRPRLRWAPVDAAGEAAAYIVELCRVDTDGDCSEPTTFDALGDSFELPKRLELGAAYRVRVRHRDSSFWSDVNSFSIVARREDRYPLRSIASDPGSHEVRMATSPDGRYLAVASVPVESAGVPVWKVDILERSGEGTEFRLLPGAGPSGHTSGGLNVRTLDLTWSLEGGTVPVILLGSWNFDTGGGPRGELQRFESWTPTLTDLLPAGFTEPVSSLTVPHLASNPRIYFETATAAPNAAPSVAGLSRWESLRDGQIWSVTLDGDDPKLHGPGRDPAISPDGKTLAYLVDTAESGPQLRLDSQDDDLQKTLDHGASRVFHLQGLAWSPRGDRIAFARDAGDGFDIVVVNLVTSEETLVTRSFEDDLSPVFLPSTKLDGSFDGILFTSIRDDRSWDVFAIDYKG